MIYIDVEGVQWTEKRVRVKRDDTVLERIDGEFYTFPVLRARWWALTHGYGWPVRR